MIINLNLKDKTVLIVGGGREAEKRLDVLVKQDCKILILSSKVSNKIKKFTKSKNIKIKKEIVKDTSFITKYKPDMIITTTDDSKLNQKILKEAKKKKILSYSSDDPQTSDFANPSIINLEKTIQIAVFTGGKSPVISKWIKTEAEKIFRKIITNESIMQLKIQEIARHEAKKVISSQINRKKILQKIMNDKKIKQFIKDGNYKNAENLAVSMVKKENEQ